MKSCSQELTAESSASTKSATAVIGALHAKLGRTRRIWSAAPILASAALAARSPPRHRHAKVSSTATQTTGSRGWCVRAFMTYSWASRRSRETTLAVSSARLWMAVTANKSTCGCAPSRSVCMMTSRQVLMMPGRSARALAICISALHASRASGLERPLTDARLSSAAHTWGTPAKRPESKSSSPMLERVPRARHASTHTRGLEEKLSSTSASAWHAPSLMSGTLLPGEKPSVPRQRLPSR
mmetsp:Transcript_10963/g.31135  ORF Transcript_10963/g.31135 Transcript_10963/m.31135 type:complete len:241 (+) Transcript_10963:130-852(+)